MSRAGALVRSVRDAVVAPSALVQPRGTAGGPVATAARSLRLTGTFLLSLVLFALPLALPGPVEGPLGFVDQLFNRFFHLLFLSIYVLGIYHVVLTATLNAKGFLRSYAVVVYGSGYYLVTSASLYDFAGRRLEWTWLRLDGPGVAVEWAQLDTLPEVAYLLLVAATVAYFGYSLYVGARVNHDADRLVALVATGLSVGVVPYLYHQIARLLRLPLLPDCLHPVNAALGTSCSTGLQVAAPFLSHALQHVP